jgi:hypothetical protein
MPSLVSWIIPCLRSLGGPVVIQCAGRAYLSHLTKYNQYLIDMSLSSLSNRSEGIVYRQYLVYTSVSRVFWGICGFVADGCMGFFAVIFILF